MSRSTLGVSPTTYQKLKRNNFANKLHNAQMTYTKRSFANQHMIPYDDVFFYVKQGQSNFLGPHPIWQKTCLPLLKLPSLGLAESEA